MFDTSEIEKNLTGEIRLDPLHAKVFLLITTQGKMPISEIAKKLGVSDDETLDACNELVNLGGLISMSDIEFEAMHPRFTAVNMYRRMCQREGIEFGRNKTVDNIGVVLERYYDDARTKYN